MLEVILLIVGVGYFFRRPKLKRLTAEAFPNVEPLKFAEWRTAAVKATDIFLMATWGAFIIKLLITLAFADSDLVRESPYLVMGMILGLWFIGLIIAAVYGSKAKKLQKAAGIKWP